MKNREIGPSNVGYRTGDYVRILTDCPYGWQLVESGERLPWNKTIKYYEGEIISLKEDEWLELGSMQIRPITGEEYRNYEPTKRRIFACGVSRRFGHWWDTFWGKIGRFLYGCIEIPCAIISWTVQGTFRSLGLPRNMMDFSAIIVFIVLVTVLAVL